MERHRNAGMTQSLMGKGMTSPGRSRQEIYRVSRGRGSAPIARRHYLLSPTTRWRDGGSSWRWIWFSSRPRGVGRDKPAPPSPR